MAHRTRPRIMLADGRDLATTNRRRLEHHLWQKMTEAGLPAPVLEYRFAAAEGRDYRADGFIPPDLLLEVDGGIWTQGRHTRGAGYLEDCRKLNLAAVLGYRVIRVTSEQIDSGEAVAFIRRALGCGVTDTRVLNVTSARASGLQNDVQKDGYI